MRLAIVLLAFLGACAQLPPSEADMQARRFEPVQGKAVIYAVRERLDSSEVAGLMLDDDEQITTLRGTYFRWVVEPGLRRIEGMEASPIRFTLQAEPGQIYYLVHTVLGTQRTGPAVTALQRTDEQTGRRLVLHSQLLR